VLYSTFLSYLLDVFPKIIAIILAQVIFLSIDRQPVEQGALQWFADLVGVEFELGWERAVADGGAFFVVGEVGGCLQARPEGVLFGGERVEGVDVRFEGERAAETGTATT
jgi:hypothetical protein